MKNYIKIMIKFILGIVLAIFVDYFLWIYIFPQLRYTLTLSYWLIIAVLMILFICRIIKSFGAFILGVVMGFLIMSIAHDTNSRLGCDHHACKPMSYWLKRELKL